MLIVQTYEIMYQVNINHFEYFFKNLPSAAVLTIDESDWSLEPVPVPALALPLHNALMKIPSLKNA
ncbi:hypothetical protein HK100_007639, partial [Physocladia obscura]